MTSRTKWFFEATWVSVFTTRVVSKREVSTSWRAWRRLSVNVLSKQSCESNCMQYGRYVANGCRISDGFRIAGIVFHSTTIDPSWRWRRDSSQKSVQAAVSPDTVWSLLFLDMLHSASNNNIHEIWCPRYQKVSAPWKCKESQYQKQGFWPQTEQKLTWRLTRSNWSPKNILQRQSFCFRVSNSIHTPSSQRYWTIFPRYA